MKHATDESKQKFTLERYQKNTKFVGVILGLLLTCVLIGQQVQFLTTLPLLILSPCLCTWFYGKSLPILLASIPCGAIGGLLGEGDSSIVFLALVSLLGACVGVLIAKLLKFAWHSSAVVKSAGLIVSLILFMIGSYAGFNLWGDPIGYIQMTVKSTNYVRQQYNKDTLRFQGISYNSKDGRQSGIFQYVLNGVSQTATIGFHKDGTPDDNYQSALAMQFYQDQSAQRKVEIGKKTDQPIFIEAHSEQDLVITRNELNDTYYRLRYDQDQLQKSKQMRTTERSKLMYGISFGEFSSHYDAMSKQDFLSLAETIRIALAEQNVLYEKITATAYDLNGNIQKTDFTPKDNQVVIETNYRAYQEK